MLALLLKGFSSDFELMNPNTAAQKKKRKAHDLNPDRWNMEAAQENLPKKVCAHASVCAQPLYKIKQFLEIPPLEKLQIKYTSISQCQEKVITIYIHIQISFIQLLLHTVSCRPNALLCL